MKVIFIKDLKGQGKRGDRKEVKDGYAENFLIKNGYAVKKTKENLSKLNHEIAKKEKETEEKKVEATKVKETLSQLVLEFKVKTGEGDKVFGSISQKQIKEELEKKGYKIDKNQIDITNPISSLGFHNVEINLFNDITATIKVHVIK